MKIAYLFSYRLCRSYREARIKNDYTLTNCHLHRRLSPFTTFVSQNLGMQRGTELGYDRHMFRFCLPTQLNQLHRENGLDVFVLPLRKIYAKYLYSGFCFRDKFMFSFVSSLSYQFKNAVCNLSTIIRFRNLIVVFVVFCMYLLLFFCFFVRSVV